MTDLSGTGSATVVMSSSETISDKWIRNLVPELWVFYWTSSEWKYLETNGEDCRHLKRDKSPMINKRRLGFSCQRGCERAILGWSLDIKSTDSLKYHPIWSHPRKSMQAVTPFRIIYDLHNQDVFSTSLTLGGWNLSLKEDHYTGCSWDWEHKVCLALVNWKAKPKPILASQFLVLIVCTLGVKNRAISSSYPSTRWT